LGEAISYGRAGGDIFIVDHFSSNTCPSGGEKASLARAVFIQETK
jgi:hypothetical protein